MAIPFVFKEKTGNLVHVLGMESQENHEKVPLWDISFESWADAGILSKMKDEDEVLVGTERISYANFKRVYLDNSNRIYLSRHRRALDIAGQVEKYQGLVMELEKLSEEKDPKYQGILRALERLIDEV